MPETIEILHRSIGINWCHYHRYQLNNKHKEAHLIQSWREHLYDSSRMIKTFETKSIDKTGAKDYQIISGHNISQWKKDGKPGGFDGCYKNYRHQPAIVVEGIKYNII